MKLPERLFRAVLLCGLAAQVAACSSAPDKPGVSAPAPDRSVYTISLSQRKLLDIIDEQHRFFERVKNKSKMNYADVLSIKTRIDSLWAEYLAEFPDDVEALIIHGKFLRATGDDKLAYDDFCKADRLNPKIAVVKQQMANYEAECGLFKESYDSIEEALKLEPDNPVYLTQQAQLILFYREEFIIKNYFTQAQLDSKMINCYRRAAELCPQSSDAQWRYAQAFYDVGRADWSVALVQWEKILKEYAPLNIDKQTALANKARVLIELNRDADAVAVLEEVNLPALQKDKNKLLALVSSSGDTRPQKNNYTH